VLCDGFRENLSGFKEEIKLALFPQEMVYIEFILILSLTKNVV
jgi:hypothetical protein